MFHKTICPVCNINLKKIEHTRHDEFYCNNSCYCYLDLFELQEKAVVIRLSNYSLIFRFGERFETISIYNYSEIGKFEDKLVMDIPLIQFEWNNLAALNERIKNLVIFS
jgi:hypothetical protein